MVSLGESLSILSLLTNVVNSKMTCKKAIVKTKRNINSKK